MKNKFLALLLSLAIVSVSGCGTKIESTKDVKESMFITIEKNNGWNVVYQRDTKVMYAVSDFSNDRGNFTLLVNPDGTPMIYWEDWDEEK